MDVLPTFAKLAGSKFAVSVDDKATESLELVAVTPYKKGHDPQDETVKIPSFSLLFAGGSTPHLPQRNYAMEHPVLGRLEIFIVPIGPGARGMQYEAVFNQI